MKKIIILLIGFLGFLNLHAQAPLIPSVRCSLTTVTVFTDPYTVTGKTSDFSSNWQASDIAAGDSLYLLDGSELRIYRVVSISSASGADFTIVIDDINNSGNVPVTGEYGALFRGTTNYDFPNVTAGISETLQMAIQNRFVQRLDALLKGIGTDYITTDSFSTFTNSATFASIPLNKTVWRTTTGSKFEKTNSTTMTKRSTDNGELARLGLQGSGAAMTFNANLYNKVKVNTGDISATTIQNPTNFSTQEVGEVFLIGVTAGSSDVAVTWGDIYGTFNGSTFGAMPSTSIPAQMTIYFKFRVITPSVETVKFQYVDGGGGAASATANQVVYGTGSGITSNADWFWNGDSTYLAITGARVDLDGQKFLHMGGTGGGDANENLFLGFRAGNAFPAGNARYANTGIGYGALKSLNGTISGAATSTSNTAVGYNAGGTITNGTYNTFIGTASGSSALASSLYNTGLGWHSCLGCGGNENVVVGPSVLGTANTASSNTAMGMFAMNLVTSNANNNVAIGKEVMGQGTNPGDFNTAVGSFALRFANSAKIGLTALGAWALYSNTTGDFTTGGGYEALYSNTTGSSNTAWGYNALRQNTTASNNTAIGKDALKAHVNGGSNVAVGALALSATVDGVQNTMVGTNAGLLNTSGSYNTAIGFDAIRNNTTGGFNTATGINALRANTTASNNTATGYNALAVNTTGANNAAYGQDALALNTTASNNTAVGALALGRKAIGSGKVGVGYFAGIWSSKDNTIAIGFNANANAADSAFTNVIVVGPNTRPTANNQITIGDANSLHTTLKSRNYVFNIDQTVGAGQDNFVMTYDNATGEIGLEAASTGTGDILNGGNAGVVTIGSNDNTLNLEAGGTTWISTTSVGNTTLTVNDNTSNGFVMAIESGGANILTANTTDGGEITSIGTTSVGSTLTLASEVTRTNGSQGIALRTISASGTSAITNGDFHIRLDATTGAKTLTLPTPAYNMILQFFRFDNNPATIITFTGTINGSVNPTTTGANSPVGLLANQYSVLELKYNGTSWEVNTSTGDILNNGNAGAVVIGSNSSTMAIESNGTTRLSFGSVGDVTSTIPDNTTGALLVNSSDGQNFITATTANAAPRLVLGSAENGGAVGQVGIRYEDVQSITSTGSFTATKSTIGVNLASTGTVTADLTGWPTATTVASNFTIINVDALGAGVDVTVALTGATWHSGSNPVLTPGQSVNCKLINGVLYPI